MEGVDADAATLQALRDLDRDHQLKRTELETEHNVSRLAPGSVRLLMPGFRKRVEKKRIKNPNL